MTNMINIEGIRCVCEENQFTALNAFLNWAKANTKYVGWNLGPCVINGKFIHFMDPETDSAWIGFEAAHRIYGNYSIDDTMNAPEYVN